MKYEKLSVFLLSKLFTDKPSSIDAMITDYLLKHVLNEEDISIQIISQQCHVGAGSVSRYVRNAGFENFSELRDLLKKEDLKFEKTDECNLAEYHVSAMRECLNSVNRNEIRELANQIRKAEKVSLFGLLKGQSAVVSLQTDLLSLGKMTYSVISPSDQIDCILHAEREDLIILFSATCSYFDYFDIRGKQEFLSRRNIWMIGNGECPEYIHHFISFTSSGIPLSHPLQLICIAEMIAQEYAITIEQ